MPEAMNEADRSFTVEESSFGISGGRYVSPVPSTAGKHAARILFRKRKNASHVYVKIREITREIGAKNKAFFYKVTKVKRPASEIKVKTFKKPDGSKVNITPEYTYEVVSVEEADFKKASRK
jgi:formylmethanofuran dehydrogenase subunit E